MLSRHPDLAALILLFAVLLGASLIYQPGLKGPLLLDDPLYLPQNQVGSLSTDVLLQKALSGKHGFSASRAIPRLSFAVTQFWSGPDASYRLKQQNLLLHLINGLLVFWLAWLLGQQQPRAGKAAGARTAARSAAPAWFALAVATVWLLHPLQVSTVLYVTQRFVLTAALFMLAALICYVQGRMLMQTRPVAGMLVVLLGVGLFGALGLLSKTIAALLPLLIAAIEWFFFSGRGLARPRWPVAVLMLLLVLLPVALGVLYVAPRLDNWLDWHPGRGFSGVERLMTQAHVIALYLKLFFVPVPGAMSLFHDNFPLTRQLDAGTVLLALAYATAVIGAIALGRRAPWIGLGILWFFICHLIESTILALELVFEHRNYLATLGLTVASLSAAGLLLSRFGVQRVAVPVVLVLIAILGTNTALRAADWGSLDRLLDLEYRRDRTSPRVLTELVNYASKQGNGRAALGFLDQLLALDLPEASAELGAMYVYCRRQQMPQALYARALEKLQDGIVSPTAVGRLGLLVDESLRDRCPALSTEQLFELTETARTSRSARSPGERCAAAEMQVRLLMNQEDWEEAGRTLAATVDVCGRDNSMMVQVVLDNVLRFGISRGQFAEAQLLIEALASDARLTEKLDRVYAGSGGFDPQWVADHLREAN